MLVYFARQDLVQRFTGNALGFAWALLGPLAQLALFALVFVHIFKSRLPGDVGYSYVAFLSLGMWPWFAFSEAVSRGTTTFTEHAGLLTKVAVPPWVLVAARVANAFLLHGLGFLLIAAVLRLTGQPLALQWLAAGLPSWAGLLVCAYACALGLAVLNVFARDLQQIVQYVLSASMFLSPILYSREMAPAAFANWLELNPLTGYVEAIRTPLLDAAPTMSFPFLALAISLALLALAAYAYRRVRPHLVEFL